MKVPDGYRGAILCTSDKQVAAENGAHENSETTRVEGGCSFAENNVDEEDMDDQDKIAIVEEHATFDTLVVWNHEVLPDEGSDPYIRAMNEWISFSDQVHSHDIDDGDDSTNKKMLENNK
ncbi:MAG: hypothetical protein M1825_004377 [Sarcosagium campestre]|nr:MAG: hypothetical protein M1825_004377 [Sarcosagium campestre]